ncbi:hypothetical protein AFM11_04110 [Mycolicibacterium wolinskyi]|uniref:Uncharacterized protein n=1 Tax=Mycolicibacterium wolinskyi TaxID=59750 RepID=A0A132PSX9_9MYCO|nr:DUF6611 family protein [Mycolicibacterium wolinskyi]KWX25449.1 hypothetical protein AFM11_04110 [Mycolicibacterium wolinskyi]
MNTGALHRFGERLLDGARAWGSVEIRPGRFGIVQYRLVVYPPGLSRSERRWLRLARGWPVWGFMVWLLCQIVLTGTMTSWAVFGASTAAATGAGVVAFAMAGEARTRVRSMLVTTMLGYPDATAEANRDRLAELAAVLLEADDRLAHGDIGVVEHELIWWQVYDRLADSVAAGPHA